MKPAFPYRGDTITLATAVAFATVRGRPPWANAVGLVAPSTTLEAITVAFTPKIERIYFYDVSLTGANRWEDVTVALTDRNTATASSRFSAMQTGDRLYIGARRQFRGLAVDVSATNGAGTASLVGEYPIQGTRAWTDLSITDGTRGTASLDTDGLITWTVPTAGWFKGTLKEATALVADEEFAPVTERLFWMRLRTDTAFTDTSVTVDEITALLNAIVVGVTPDNEGFSQVRFASGNHGETLFELHPDIGGIELVSATLTSTAIVNWYSLSQSQAR